MIKTANQKYRFEKNYGTYDISANRAGTILSSVNKSVNKAVEWEAPLEAGQQPGRDSSGSEVEPTVVRRAGCLLPVRQRESRSFL